MVSNEGRAQRFFQVYQPQGNISESWRWLIQLASSLGNEEVGGWKNIDSVINAISKEVISLKGLEKEAHDSSFRVNGQKIPRAPHRYSGRTAMNAHLEVSELKPLEDPDSSMSYTMEGVRNTPPTNAIPFFWSPGWNSVQSVNKYQEEVGGALRAGDPGLRLIEPAKSSTAYYNSIPETFTPSDQKLLIVPLHHIFGSEELSAKAPAVSQRVSKAYAAISKSDADRMGVESGNEIEFNIGDDKIKLPVKINHSLPKGTVGIPVGLNGVGHISYLMKVEIKK